MQEKEYQPKLYKRHIQTSNPLTYVLPGSIQIRFFKEIAGHKEKNSQMILINPHTHAWRWLAMAYYNRGYCQPLHNGICLIIIVAHTVPASLKTQQLSIKKYSRLKQITIDIHEIRQCNRFSSVIWTLFYRKALLRPPRLYT